LELRQRIRRGVQVFLRKMNIARRGLEVSVPQQHLDGAQVGAGFEQVRRPTMSERLLVLLMICSQEKSAIAFILSMT
jgi:hypothetical protein